MRDQYITLGVLKNIVEAIPGSSTSDTVTIEIKRLSDDETWNFSTLAFTAASTTGNMTSVAGEIWKQSFTPPTADTYVVTIEDTDIGIKWYVMYVAVGSDVTAPVGGVTLAKLKTWLQIDEDDFDGLLTDILARGQATLESRCNRKFDQATFTEYFSGDGLTDAVYVRNIPIISVTSVHDDTARSYGAGTLIASTDYVTDDDIGRIQLDGFKFLTGLKNIKVIYDGGFATLDQEFVDAILKESARSYVESQSMQQENLDSRLERWTEEINRFVDDHKVIYT